MSANYQPKYIAKDWDNIRVKMMSSPMADIGIGYLAENAGVDWKWPSGDLMPSEFLHMEFSELSTQPKFASAQIIDAFIEICRETLSFDNPFGSMVENELASTEENEVLKKAVRLNIPQDYPLRYTAISDDTKAFCKGESIETLGQLMEFSSNMAQQIVIGGDFRDLLNAISSEDTVKMATFLPYRPGEKGFHLPEAILILHRCLPKEIKTALFLKYGGKLNFKGKKRPNTHSPFVLQAEQRIQSDLIELLKYYNDSWSNLEKAANTYEQALVFFKQESDLVLRTLSAASIYYHVTGKYPTETSLWTQILGWFKRS
jgi:hypothetical protein